MISGYFDLGFFKPMPRLTVGLYLPGISKRFAVVDFIIDTGCTTTLLHPTDAITKVGINRQALADPNLWRATSQAVGTAGTTTNYRAPAVYAFLHDDGQVQTVQDEIDIAQPAPGNATLPSLLGWNVLQYFSLTADLRSRQVTLTP